MSVTLTGAIAVPGGFAANPVVAKGEGNPLVFLHGPFGPEWPGYLDDLAEQHRVFAPSTPGVEDAADLALLDDLSDLVLYYDDLFDTLGLDQIDLVGHSFGGMVAAEIAAVYGDRVRRLVLIDPMGLWLDALPTNDHVLAPVDRRNHWLYHDHENAEVAERLVVPDDIAEGQAKSIREFSAIAATSHFTFPIAEHGLSKRLRRIRAKTLVLWGAQDGLMSAKEYSQAFRTALPDATVQIIENAGHYPYLEQRDAVSRLTLEFLSP
jgi:pimeloyl-ACP methyl ester carboxylesterase